MMKTWRVSKNPGRDPPLSHGWTITELVESYDPLKLNKIEVEITNHVNIKESNDLGKCKCNTIPNSI